MSKKRNSSIELLRIISIFFIVLSHYSVHNGVDNSSLSLGFNRFLLEISSLGNIGVILFILISGYFMVENHRSFKFSKLLILYFQVLFYSVGVYGIFLVLGYETFSFKELIKNLFPFVFHRYWFVTAYMILYIISPYINKLLNSLTRNEYLRYLLVMFLFTSVLPTFMKRDFYGNELIQFVLFYSIGGYLRKYQDNILIKNRKVNNIILLSVTILLLSSVAILDCLDVKGVGLGIDSIYFFSRTSCLSIIFSITFFNLFSNMKEFYSKKINVLSSCVFGIYLLSDNCLIRSVLWVDFLKNYLYVDSVYLIPHLIASILLVFLFCGIVEFIRKKTVEKIFLLMLEKKFSLFRFMSLFRKNENNVKSSNDNSFAGYVNHI